jgi:transposase
MNINRIGIDLAKQVFQVYSVDGQEKPELRKQLRRTQKPGISKVTTLVDWHGSLW